MAAPSSVDKLIVIVGETSTGKTALAIELAKKFNGEIVSADSWAVYKDFDIGTAKPSAQEQKQAVFHLINVTTANKGFSAAIFKRLAEAAIRDIKKRGKLPILVGGTGLYIDSILYDYHFLPAGLTGQREELNKLTIEELLDKLKSQNITIEGIDTRNKRRLIRLLEAGGQRPSRSKINPNVYIIGLQLLPELLEENIEKRVDAMLASGLESEVRGLAKRYDWNQEPMKGIGYREWQLYLAGTQNMEQTRERIISGTRQLAKKQRTWFKRNKSIQWVQEPREAVELLTTFLNKNGIKR